MNRFAGGAAALAVICASLGLLTSCADTESAARQETVVEEQALTQEEINILCDIYTDEERIKAGKLYAYQEECLNQIRCAKNYLTDKYNEEFQVQSYAPITKMNRVGEMYFTQADSPDVFYALQLQKEADGEGYAVSDNYYGALIRETYDQALQDILQNKLHISCRVYTLFTSLKGADMDASQTVEELFALGSDLDRDTSVYCNQEELDTLAIEEQIRAVAEENRLYGSYSVYYAPGLIQEDSAAEQIREQLAKQMTDGISVISFDCFDIE